MCGITGAIELKKTTNYNFQTGSDMHQYISSRGPDFFGNTAFEIGKFKVSLAHSRLAIIDLTEESNQPMKSVDGRFALTFNGEIYNYKEVRDELIGLGLTFSTKGDTEVLLSAWRIWGEKCLSKLNGMFAFAIFDVEKNELFLVRDRFGVKPLLYSTFDGNELLFSSSIASVAKYAGDEVDLQYCSKGLRYGFFEGNGNLSPFKNVKYVLPGTYLKFSIGSRLEVEETIWYSLEAEITKKTAELLNYTEGELIESGHNLLNNSTKLRLNSDVPLAISLSGGVDSSSIAVLAKQHTSTLTGFCYGSPENCKSEGPLVDRFIKEKEIDIHYIQPNYSPQELGDLFDRTMAAQEAPFFGLSIMAQQEVYRAVHNNGFKVLLGGQGGDEIFAGYRKFFFVALKNAMNKHNVCDSISLLYSLGILLMRGIGDYKTYWQQRNRYFKKDGKSISYINQLPRDTVNLLGSSDMTLKKRQIYDVQHYSIPSLLRYEDRNSMSFAIESRLPLMDYRIVEFAIALNDSLKIRNGLGKWAFREMMKSEVPSYILFNHVKRGFDVTQNWINEGIGNRMKANILENKSKLKDYVADFDVLEKNIQNYSLNNDSSLLNEVMLLNFLAEPIKPPIVL
jgi:asparagine synthase (glutamine-hydrolysing)